MAEFTFSVIYLGNQADLDPIDGNFVAENQAALLGTYYGSGDAASGHITILTAQDTNANNLISSNDTVAPEAVSYDIGGGTVTTQYDMLFNVDATVTFQSGSGEPPYTGLGGIIQAETGDLFFVMIDDDAGIGANSFDNVPIQSIEVTGIQAVGVDQSATASDTESFVPCFTAGTEILTDQGLLPVHEIRTVDRVATLDNGYQPIVWVGRRSLSARQLSHQPKSRAICIEAGALGQGYPDRDLIVSPQHRVMLRSKITQRMTDEPEILVAATKLVGFPGIRQLECGLGVQYHHFACASHEVIWANGAPAETLLLGPQSDRILNPEAQEDLRLIMPVGFSSKASGRRKPARLIVQNCAFLGNLKSRHIKNGQELLSL